MNKDSKLKLQKAVDTLKKLHFKEEDIMVTGSIALDLYGLLPNGRPIHDVDLIIKMDDQTWRCLKLIEAINQADEKSVIDESYASKKNTVFLDVKGLTLNIWRYEGEWSDIKEAETGVYVATVEHIINAKKKYARSKDFMDIAEICKKIL